MRRPSIARNGLRLLACSRRRCYVTDADVASARKYCLTQLHKGDYDAHIVGRFVPRSVRDAYAALRALNLELVRLPETVSNPTIGALRIQFWQESLDSTFAGRPPREPICILLHQALRELEAWQAAGDGFGGDSVKSVRFWVSRLVRTRGRHMEGRPFASLAALEDYAEGTYSTMMYATLALMPVRSAHLDHLASHIGKACGIVAVLRGVPVLAAPARPIKTPAGAPPAPNPRQPSLLLPLDILAEEGVKEEAVFRQGPRAPGLKDAMFRVATRAHDHLATARDMLARLQRGDDAGHDFEHEHEDGHTHIHGYGGGDQEDLRTDVHRSFGIFLEALPAGLHLESLEKANFDPFAVRSNGWKLPWRIWKALAREKL